MKKILVLLITGILLGSLCLSACGKKEEEALPTEAVIDPEIVGTWMEDYWDSGYRFAEDGTGEDIFWKQTFHFEAENGNLTIVYDEGLWAEKEFTYQVNGDTLTLTEVPDPDAKGSKEAGTWNYKKTS